MKSSDRQKYNVNLNITYLTTSSRILKRKIEYNLHALIRCLQFKSHFKSQNACLLPGELSLQVPKCKKTAYWFNCVEEF